MLHDKLGAGFHDLPQPRNLVIRESPMPSRSRATSSSEKPSMPFPGVVGCLAGCCLEAQRGVWVLHVHADPIVGHLGVDELGAVRREERVRHRVSHRRGLTVRSGRPTRILLMTQGEDRGRQRQGRTGVANERGHRAWLLSHTCSFGRREAIMCLGFRSAPPA